MTGKFYIDHFYSVCRNHIRHLQRTQPHPGLGF